jgi:hypothetical protein
MKATEMFEILLEVLDDKYFCTMESLFLIGTSLA